MIIFDLDGTLADCSHRRHFVDPSKNPHCFRQFHFAEGDLHHKFYDRRTKELFKPDWKAFYEACDKDEPIWTTIKLLQLFQKNPNTEDIYIWSGRCESVIKKTIHWIEDFIDPTLYWNWDKRLKMRPIGDYTPDDQLKEKWLDEAIAEDKKVEMVFDDRPKVIRMWQRRGIFTFDVGQGMGEF